MAAKTRHQTGIQWTHVPGYIGATWNPTTGCTRVSPGCDHCYAFTLHDQRHIVNRDHARKYAMEPESYRRALANGADLPPLPMAPQYDVPFSRVQLLDEHRLTEPLRVKKPRAYFVDSMSDLFHEAVPNEVLDRVFAVMSLSPQHIFMILTKRLERMRAYLTSRGRAGRVTMPLVDKAQEIAPAGLMTINWPLPNVWLGVSVEDQQRADERIPLLLDTPAAVRFLSCEPLLGSLDLTGLLRRARPRPGYGYLNAEPGSYEFDRVDWVIVGGESGPHSRPFDLGWARAIREECQGAGVSLFVKQMGSRPFDSARDAEASARGATLVWQRVRHNHGGNHEEWPEDLRVREFPAGYADWFSQAVAS